MMNKPEEKTTGIIKTYRWVNILYVNSLGQINELLDRES